MTFALDLSAFAKKTDAKIEAVTRSIVLGVAKELIERSPVGNPENWLSLNTFVLLDSPGKVRYGIKPPKGYTGGRFRGSWDYGMNALPASLHRGVDPTGDVSLGRITGKLPKVLAGAVHYIANNTPYAVRLENGWSRQAPQGMVSLTVIKYQQIVREAAAAVR